MAIRELVNITDKASLVPGVAGLALTLEQANTAFPEGGNKRQLLNLSAVSTGATPVELFVGGVNAFRIKPVADSVLIMQVSAVYYASVAGSRVAFDLIVACTNSGGTVALLGAVTTTKFGAGASNLVVTAGANGIIFTGTGVAGDLNGRWAARANITEVTDLG